jgi:hypothetical protein
MPSLGRQDSPRPSRHARPPRGPSNPPFRRQLSYLVVPPYWYVATTYLLCFSLLRKHRGCGGILPILVLRVVLAMGTRYITQVLFFHSLAHSFARSCTHQKLNSSVFKRFRTLCTKNWGWGAFPSLPTYSLPTTHPLPIQSQISIHHPLYHSTP